MKYATWIRCARESDLLFNEVGEGSFGAAILCQHDSEKERDTKASAASGASATDEFKEIPVSFEDLWYILWCLMRFANASQAIVKMIDISRASKQEKDDALKESKAWSSLKKPCRNMKKW